MAIFVMRIVWICWLCRKKVKKEVVNEIIVIIYLFTLTLSLVIRLLKLKQQGGGVLTNPIGYNGHIVLYSYRLVGDAECWV